LESRVRLSGRWKTHRQNAADSFVQNEKGVSLVGLARRISNYDVAKFFGDLRN
jgi:hypothetical protein